MKQINNIISENIEIHKNNFITVSNNFSNDVSINNIIDNTIDNTIDDTIGCIINCGKSDEIIVELPTKKKKGRKSKKNKALELEKIKPKEIPRPFPKLCEKIFDVLNIDKIEYFYDTDFNLLLDENVEPVGFKNKDKFIFYSETLKFTENIKKDDDEVKLLVKSLIKKIHT